MAGGAAARRARVRAGSLAGLARTAALALAALALAGAALVLLRPGEASQAGVAAPSAGGPSQPPIGAGASERQLVAPAPAAPAAARDALAEAAPPAAPPAPAPERVGTPVASAPDLPRAGVDGRLCAPDGTGLTDLDVRLRDRRDGTLRATRTGLDGVFRLEGVLPGVHELWIGAGDPPFAPPVAVAVDAPYTLLSDVVCPALGTLELLVRDASGQPVADAPVECIGIARGVARATTDADGRALVGPLVAGELRAFVRHPHLGRANRSFAFDPAGATRLEIVLQGRAP